METVPHRHTRALYRLVVLGILLLIARGAEGAVKVPPVDGAPEFAWDRQTFFPILPRWDVDKILPTRDLAAAVGEKEVSDAPEPAVALFRRAKAKSDDAGRVGNPSHLHEEAARLFLQAYAASKHRELGYLSLTFAARAYFRAGSYQEAGSVANRLIERAGTGDTGLEFYLLKAESLAQQKNYLSARECFRRAAGGKWDADTREKISLRIADMSFLMGNIMYAEPAYRKSLSSPDAFRRFPFESVRYGETLLSAGRTDEALAVFRKLQSPGFPVEARGAGYLGEGDVSLVQKNPEGARIAYRQAENHTSLPMRWWIECRKADLAFADGRRAEASTRYKQLAECPDASVAREALYKHVLTLYLLPDNAGVLREATAYLSLYPGKSGEGSIRRMASKAGTALVQEAGGRNPAERWPALSSFLFAFGRQPEGKTIWAGIGKEWETARIWGGAASLYTAAGDASRSRDMLRMEAAERAYYQGDFARALAALGIADISRESSRPVLWLSARIHFREGRFEDAAKALHRMESLPPDGDPPAKVPPQEKELRAFVRAMQEQWSESREALSEIDPKSQTPGVRLLRALAEQRVSPASSVSEPGKGKGAAGGSDFYDVVARSQERYRRLSAWMER